MAESAALLCCFQLVAEGSSRPGGSFREEGLEDCNGLSESFVQRFDFGEIIAVFHGDR